MIKASLPILQDTDNTEPKGEVEFLMPHGNQIGIKVEGSDRVVYVSRGGLKKVLELLND